MEITIDPLNWDSDDIAAWNAFLGTKTGRRLIPKLVEAVPQLLEHGHLNKILIRSGEVRGWADAARTLLTMAREPERIITETPAYPPLDADEHWNDNQKLTS